MSAHNFIDLTKQPFGELIVTSRVENNKRKQACWKCKCSCGNIIIVSSGQLRGGQKSCGCLRYKRICNLKTHGMTGTPEHNTWRSILTRCTNSNHPAFKYYGGRGIGICDEWKDDFMVFFNYVGPRPSKVHSIDRIENDGNYEPGNVRWATDQEQKNNSRNNHKITIHEWTMNLCQWAQFVGKKAPTIRKRLKYGWPPAKAIFYPILPHGLNYL